MRRERRGQRGFLFLGSNHWAFIISPQMSGLASPCTTIPNVPYSFRAYMELFRKRSRFQRLISKAIGDFTMIVDHNGLVLCQDSTVAVLVEQHSCLREKLCPVDFIAKILFQLGLVRRNTANSPILQTEIRFERFNPLKYNANDCGLCDLSCQKESFRATYTPLDGWCIG